MTPEQLRAFHNIAKLAKDSRRMQPGQRGVY